MPVINVQDTEIFKPLKNIILKKKIILGNIKNSIDNSEDKIAILKLKKVEM